MSDPARASAPRSGTPLPPAHPCTLCHPESHLGPQDCLTVVIVREDPDLSVQAARLRREHARTHRLNGRQRPHEGLGSSVPGTATGFPADGPRIVTSSTVTVGWRWIGRRHLPRVGSRR